MDKDSQNYYDVLNVRRDCSGKEIRSAFLELSKKYHPDVSVSVKSNPKDAEKFVKIYEAYQTLSKPKMRKEYDNLLLQGVRSSERRIVEDPSNTTVHGSWEVRPDVDAHPGPYYGVKGWSRISNSKIGLALFIVGIIGGLSGIASVKRSHTYQKTRIDEVSAKASEHHEKIRSDARKYGKEEQVQRVANRIFKRIDS
uniref:J domain-containing protein n=1 Tax=Glossina austeni TaxID=7395 RepID=A0A1A9VQS2_GLOAU